MSRANPPLEGWRECPGCRQVFELTPENFGKAKACRGGLDVRCRPCRRLYKRDWNETRLPHPGRSEPRKGRLCIVCFGQSHRRCPLGCRGCGEPYAPLPELSAVDCTQNHYEPVWPITV